VQERVALAYKTKTKFVIFILLLLGLIATPSLTDRFRGEREARERPLTGNTMDFR
jgi:hypothetical protein